MPTNSSVWPHLHFIFSLIFFSAHPNHLYEKQKPIHAIHLEMFYELWLKFRYRLILIFLNWIERFSIQYIPWCSHCTVHCGLSTQFSFQQYHHSMITISYYEMLSARCLLLTFSKEHWTYLCTNFQFQVQFKFYHISIECCRNSEIGRSRMLALFFCWRIVNLIHIISDYYIEFWALRASNTKHHLQIH